MKKRPLRMRQLSKAEIGNSRQAQMYIFSPSPDPYITVVVNIDAQPLFDVISDCREKTGKPITMVHIFNKLLGTAFKIHPEYNSIVLDRRIYEMENVTISNPYLLPGDAHSLTLLLVEDPQDKTIEEIHDFFQEEKGRKLAEYEQFGENKISLVPKLYIRSKLYKIISEKMQFKTVFERSLTSNLVLSKANTSDTKNFLATKGATQILRTFMRFFLHTPKMEPEFVDGQWVARPVVPFTMMLDHRLIDGYHVNAFVRTINEIVADAGNRLK